MYLQKTRDIEKESDNTELKFYYKKYVVDNFLGLAIKMVGNVLYLSISHYNWTPGSPSVLRIGRWCSNTGA